MSLADWDKFGSTYTVSIDNATPLVGSGSLFIDFSGSSNSSRGNLLPKDPGSLSGKLIRGKIRALFQYTVLASNNGPGLFCLASQRDLSSTGSCYFISFKRDQINRLTLYKSNNVGTTIEEIGGLTPLAFAVLSTSANTTYSLELEWYVDIPNLSGTQLKVRVGSATDFSDLALVMSTIDVSSPLTTTVGEGISLSGSGGSNDYRADKTTLISLV
jgi:hypothetical protein